MLKISSDLVKIRVNAKSSNVIYFWLYSIQMILYYKLSSWYIFRTNTTKALDSFLNQFLHPLVVFKPFSTLHLNFTNFYTPANTWNKTTFRIDSRAFDTQLPIDGAAPDLQSFRCSTRTSGSLRRKCSGANHKTTSGKEGRWRRQKKAEGKTILPAPETNTTGNTSRIMAGWGAGGRWRNQRAFMQIKLQKLLGTRVRWKSFPTQSVRRGWEILWKIVKWLVYLKFSTSYHSIIYTNNIRNDHFFIWKKRLGR